jgi:hypothetical protein
MSWTRDSGIGISFSTMPVCATPGRPLCHVDPV